MPVPACPVPVKVWLLVHHHDSTECHHQQHHIAGLMQLTGLVV